MRLIRGDKDRFGKGSVKRKRGLVQHHCTRLVLESRGVAAGFPPSSPEGFQQRLPSIVFLLPVPLSLLLSRQTAPRPLFSGNVA